MLRATVRWLNSWPSWNISAKPRLWVGTRARSEPSQATVPATSGSSPATARSRVDFPQPDGPSTASTCPSGSSRLASRTAGVPS